VKIAIQTPPENCSFAALEEVWQTADEAGFAAAFTFDHLVPLNAGARPNLPIGVPDGPQFEGWATLCALAARTKNMQVGTLVSGITYRPPIILAKMAVTLDHITRGRAILGVGAAWHEVEHKMYGIEYPAVGERMTRLDEALQIFKRLFTEDEVTFDGSSYQLSKAVFDPKPVRKAGIPLLVGGSGNRLKNIVARNADIFNSFAAPWEWADVNADLDARMAKHGRNPKDLMRTAFVFSDLSGDAAKEEDLLRTFQKNRGGTDEEVRKRIVIGDPDNMINVLKGYEEAGIEMAILNLRPPFSAEEVERFAREVLVAFG
jgi:alkanesulfonate monooxygenase SsuD/methylene tetrahydromethanopterin reductase-like flavin-dependent oxidoreductase (luciferase family)